MKTLLVFAPHPDDETLGCGGTILKAQSAGHQVIWVITTSATIDQGYSEEFIGRQETQITNVSHAYNFYKTNQLEFPTSTLDQIPLNKIISSITESIEGFQVFPTHLYLPFLGDAHSDHRVVFDATTASFKWFRKKSIQHICCYETQSETDYRFKVNSISFTPNQFAGISDRIDQKIEIAKLYKTEFNEHPFPRNEEGIRALATVREATSGHYAAQAFQIITSRTQDL